MIEIENVTKRFDDLVAVDQVSLRLDRGQTLGLIGPNGAGKTTLLRLISTLARPDSGDIRVEGESAIEAPRAVRLKLGFMPAEFGSPRNLTIGEYLEYFGCMYGIRKVDREQRIKDVCELTDLAGREEVMVKGLSTGNKQRLLLAKTLLHDPEVLVLDEPASGLDPRARTELRAIVRALASMGKTIIISSHILSELAELCDSVTIIDRGRVRYNGTMDGLLEGDEDFPRWRLTPTEPLNGVIEKLGQAPGIMGVETIEGSQDVLIAFDPAFLDTNAVLKLAMELGISVTGFTKAQKHLNQAFMDLTEKGVRE